MVCRIQADEDRRKKETETKTKRQCERHGEKYKIQGTRGPSGCRGRDIVQ